jgi:hypothetical protein
VVAFLIDFHCLGVLDDRIESLLKQLPVLADIVLVVWVVQQKEVLELGDSCF